ncbi:MULTISPECIES: hypothetical protein [Chryseobacterium]|uniref:DUF4252 domain-containing protein n=1 Tax=Chryseobacterium caseinilyticum TaxID=2771428 RepID=A0ABR8Z8G3_9FLAO|nr:MULTISPECIES: hypothetical protein [Chryseobacterium]KQS92512.1 hypothetical protein ASG21_08750 [Chryseobacterium sp. Leaf394]MBD8081594.1 hypothetical protein [Chryseobacterium caseinilyticum]
MFLKSLFIAITLSSSASFAQDKDQEEIYSLLINSFPEKEIKISNKVFSVGYEISDDEEYRMYMRKFLFLKKSTCKNFIKNKGIKSIINNNFFTDKKIIITDNNGEELLRFSNIGFSTDKNQALVQYRKNETYLVLFDLKNGKWFLKTKINNHYFLQFISNNLN